MTAKKKKSRPKKRPSAGTKRKLKAVFSSGDGPSGRQDQSPRDDTKAAHERRQSEFLAANARATFAALDIKDAVRRREEDEGEKQPWYMYIQPRE